MIPSHTLAKKILDNCPELNISQKELSEQIGLAFLDYATLSDFGLFGYLPHYIPEDYEIVSKYPCSFCGHTKCHYVGKKDVTSSSYRAFAVCDECNFAEEF